MIRAAPSRYPPRFSLPTIQVSAPATTVSSLSMAPSIQHGTLQIIMGTFCSHPLMRIQDSLIGRVTIAPRIIFGSLQLALLTIIKYS